MNYVCICMLHFSLSGHCIICIFMSKKSVLYSCFGFESLFCLSLFGGLLNQGMCFSNMNLLFLKMRGTIASLSINKNMSEIPLCRIQVL